MLYFKIYNGQNVIAVCTDLNFVRYQKKHNILLSCDKDHVQYILLDDKLYRDSWMKPEVDNPLEYTYTTIVAINEDEYEVLRKALETDEVVPEPIVQEHVEKPDIESAEPDIEYVRDMKIKELSLACRNAILSGFDYNDKHYSLAIEDQLELQSCYLRAINGENCLYHADGEMYQTYSAEDIIAMYNKAEDLKTHHRIYFNTLKQKVLGLKTMKEIDAVKY